MIGHRDLGSAYTFMHDLAERLSHRVPLTTDGHKPYLEAVERVRDGDRLRDARKDLRN